MLAWALLDVMQMEQIRDVCGDNRLYCTLFCLYFAVP